jgi:exopolysaccharide biosynthesis polyprenyl glycosylphosphotransferase
MERRSQPNSLAEEQDLDSMTGSPGVDLSVGSQAWEPDADDAGVYAPTGHAGPVASGSRLWRRSVAMIATDGICLVLAFALGAAARQPLGPREGPGFSTGVTRDLPYIPVFIVVMAAYGLYRRWGRRVRQTSFSDLGARTHALAAAAVASLALSDVAHRFWGSAELGWVQVSFMALGASLVLPIGRSTAAWVFDKFGAYRSRVLIVGAGDVARSLAERLRRCSDIDLVGFVDDEPHAGENGAIGPHLGRIDELPIVCAQTKADRVLVAFSRTRPKWVAETLRELPPNVRVSLVPRLYELVTWQSQIEDLHGLTLMDLAPRSLDPVSRTVKRALDVTVSAILLVVLSPFFVIVSVAIRLSSPGPALFRQWRTGYRGQSFRIYKFRTMDVNADELKIDLRNETDGPNFKLRNDPRVTRVGRLLRRTSLDELPQLINVFLGDMSLVGPRPFPVKESAAIGGWAARRFDVRPGMTGLWQVSGRTDLPFEELRQLDYAYVASWSLWSDVKILWHTPGSVFSKHGAY